MRIAAGGITLNYEIEGSGTPLVLTHGLGDSLRFWDGVTPALASHHAVMRWDVRGFGASDKPPGPYSAALFAADLAALLDALGMERVHLGGISMGGVIAQRFALDHPERLRSLILCSTSSEIGAAGTAAWRRLADAIEQRGFGGGARDASRSFAPSFAAAHPDVVAAAGAQTASNAPFAYAAAARAMSDYHWTADLARVRVPVLILQGLADQLTPPGGSVKMQRALPAARLLMFPDAGHNLPLERGAELSAAVAGFTGGVDAAAALR
ncbi:alpha/beta fold hydrolase [bacterium]|nr:alpha/beta fold hydrolase [bacterium]